MRRIIIGSTPDMGMLIALAASLSREPRIQERTDPIQSATPSNVFTDSRGVEYLTNPRTGQVIRLTPKRK